MAVSITCPYCRTTFRNKIITRHGLINCGRCGKAFRI